MNSQESEPAVPYQMYELWRIVDDICGRMGWRWTKVRRGTSVCRIECFASGNSTSDVRILFNADEKIDMLYAKNPRVSTSGFGFLQSESDEVQMFHEALIKGLQQLPSRPRFRKKHKPTIFKNLETARRARNEPLTLKPTLGPTSSKLLDLSKLDALIGVKPKIYPPPIIHRTLAFPDITALASILANRSDFQTPIARKDLLQIAGVYRYIDVDLSGPARVVAQNVLLRINEKGYIRDNELAMSMFLSYLIQDETLPIVEKRLLQKHLDSLRTDSNQQAT